MISEKLSEVVRAVALTSPSKRRVGCVLLRRGRVVVAATNLDGKTHPAQARLATRAGQPFRISLHAEIRSLLRDKDSQCDTLVVGRINQSGKFCLSKPCPVCQLAISESNIKKIYYSTDQGGWDSLHLT